MSAVVSRRRLPRHLLPLLLLAGALVGSPGCDKGNPVAPEGTVLTISAPAEIGANGKATVLVIAFRKTIPAGGIQIRLTTTLGRVTPEVATTDSGGEARFSLEGNGQTGTAKLTASSGAATAVTADVKIGAKVEKLTLNVSPTTVPEGADTTVSLAALVRDDRGEAVAQAAVVFGAEIGTLASGGAIRHTNERGQATDSLRLSAGELSVIADGKIDVRAEVVGGGGSATATSVLTILQKPRASFSFTPTRLTVVFTDTSTGNPSGWEWAFGDGNTSTEQNPAHTYAAAGSYVVTLKAKNAQGDNTTSKVVTVSAT